MAKGNSSSTKAASKMSKKRKVVEPPAEVVENNEVDVDEEESPPSSGRKISRKIANTEEFNSRFLGDPVPADEAKLRWPHRYLQKAGQGANNSKSSEDDDDDYIIPAKCHYFRAEVDGSKIFELNDCAHVQAEGDKPPYICKIVEMFEGVDGLPYFRAQWFYRSVDTVIEDGITLREAKRVFSSEIMDDNPLDCLLEKLNIVRVTPNLDLDTKMLSIPDCDYYYDLKYLIPYSTYITPPEEVADLKSESESTISSDVDVPGACGGVKSDSDDVHQGNESHCREIKVLDLYSGCGAMSTGLCLGANLHGSNVVARWAVDINEFACHSLALNHPETNVRNESVGDFLILLKEWPKICASFGLIQSETHGQIDSMMLEDVNNDEDDHDEVDNQDEEVFEVDKIIGICYGDPIHNDKPGLYFKVHWKGYGKSEDSWEPLEGLSNCREKIGEFVKRAYEERFLPFPGDVDVVCGGPPCQGVSGFNRFRNAENPLADPKNEQLVVYMDVVNYLRPKYALMENVVDLVKFSNGFLGRYAIGKLVDMNYQARMGMMAAGAYGLPQFRMRVFIWGAQPSEQLPQYPLPTHDLVLRGFIPKKFEMNTVAYNEGHDVQLENKLLLGDAISDMPEVTNSEKRDEISYSGPPKTEFQRFIRMTKEAMLGVGSELITKLYDHQPLELNVDDYQRVCRIPKKKGACFRDLPGVRVRQDNKVEWDPDVERVYLPSKKPLVPDYAMTFVHGTSSKPFARLWWDVTVPTVVTRAEPHNQAILHPLQDRVLTIRENARLQGFPDYYKLVGGVKDRYIQVGNAVAVPVARALGYALSTALTSDAPLDGALMSLPAKFPLIHENRASSQSVEDKL